MIVFQNNRTRALLILLWISVTLLFAGCSSNKNGGSIEDNLNVIVSNPSFMVSSNPHTYIEKESEAYKAIVSKGEQALIYLTNELRTSQQNGLKQWIMAKACEDILQEHSPVRQWSTGKEWIEKYDASK